MRRDAVVREIQNALTSCCSGSRVDLRGSLAAGTADEYSDIDLAWTVPDERFAGALARVSEVLNELHPVESVRSDPDFQRSAKRRLLFVLFQDLPLFWRLDLEVWAASVAGNTAYDSGEPGARGDDWSPGASALANAVAVVKAVRRGRSDDARGLLDRGLVRVGASAATGDWAADLERLARAAVAGEPALAEPARRVRDLVRESQPG
jgi:predicted nucleotidyltransferase